MFNPYGSVYRESKFRFSGGEQDGNLTKRDGIMHKKELLPNEFWQDDKWAHAHYQELARRYPNQWVAVFRKTVVSSGENLGQVEKEAEKRADGKDFPLMFIEKGAHVYKD